jgi:hypothetical protein
MFKHIFGQAIMQLTVLIILLFTATHLIYETNETMINYGYHFAKCFDWDRIPHSPVIHYKGDLEDKKIFLITGFESLFSNTDTSAYLDLPGCQETFPEARNIKKAYHIFIEVKIF